jgi:nucleoside-diphosphate kinase
MIEQTLVVLKPDSVARGLMGRVISRFEDAGLKIVGMKMQWVDEEFAAKHYFDVGVRHGEKMLKMKT